MRKINAWEAIHENPEVLCAVGKTPADAFKSMAKLMKQRKDAWASSASISYSEDEDAFYLTVYI